MQIDNKKYEKIVITTKENEVVTVISDDNIIEHNGYKVILDSYNETE
ncbi:MAG: hypothetical protein H0Z24_05810 [Thermosipho sp. (in: Bacteria)]|nr:hypothetical protein [Thermosipho sp. (in: thermotogales)]